MSFTTFDTVAFLAYFLIVGAVAVLVSRRERDAADYFLAGRSLPWWLIGISLIASNISTEHFVGMAGSAVDFGLAIASYEWMAALTLIVVARWFLPKLLANRITTMLEYLEQRSTTGHAPGSRSTCSWPTYSWHWQPCCTPAAWLSKPYS